MELSVYLIFLATTSVVVFSPGAAAITIASQGAGNGVRNAFFGVLGVALANVIYFGLSATGLAALLIASNVVFATIKWVGVAYLVYLGLTAIFSKTGGIDVRTGAPKKRSTLFSQGLIVELANPKALLYFAAILPQFLDLTKPILTQIIIMGATTTLIDLTAYTIYAYLGARLTSGGIRDWIIKLVNRTAGGALILAGVKMASVSAAQ